MFPNNSNSNRYMKSSCLTSNWGWHICLWVVCFSLVLELIEKHHHTWIYMKRNDIPNTSEVLFFVFPPVFFLFFWGGCWGKGKGHAAKHQHGHADQRRFHRKPRRSSSVTTWGEKPFAMMSKPIYQIAIPIESMGLVYLPAFTNTTQLNVG